MVHGQVNLYLSFFHVFSSSLDNFIFFHFVQLHSVIVTKVPREFPAIRVGKYTVRTNFSTSKRDKPFDKCFIKSYHFPELRFPFFFFPTLGPALPEFPFPLFFLPLPTPILLASLALKIAGENQSI